MSKILFAKQDGVYVLKFVGDIRVALGPTISKFIDKIGKYRHQSSIIIDLTETTNIDSTSLGLLVKMSLRSQEALGVKPTLVSTNEDVNRILSSMGFDKVFVIIDKLATDCSELAELPTRMVSEVDLREQVLSAHKTLMTLNSKNHASFRNLVDALEKEKQSQNITYQNRKAS